MDEPALISDISPTEIVTIQDVSLPLQYPLKHSSTPE